MYYALTTTSPRERGWRVLAIRDTKQATEEAGLAELDKRHPGPIRDIYAETEYRNFVVLSKTAAERGRYIPHRDSLESFV